MGEQKNILFQIPKPTLSHRREHHLSKNTGVWASFSLHPNTLPLSNNSWIHFTFKMLTEYAKNYSCLYDIFKLG